MAREEPDLGATALLALRLDLRLALGQANWDTPPGEYLEAMLSGRLFR